MNAKVEGAAAFFSATDDWQDADGPIEKAGADTCRLTIADESSKLLKSTAAAA